METKTSAATEEREYDWTPGDISDVLMSHINSSNMGEYVNWDNMKMKPRRDLIARCVLRMDDEELIIPAKVLQMSSHTDIRYLQFDLELFVCAIAKEDFLEFVALTERHAHVENDEDASFVLEIENKVGDRMERPFCYYELIRHPFMMTDDIYTLTVNVPNNLFVRR